MMFTMIAAFGFSQVIFQVQNSTPTTLQGTYPLTWADPSGNDWATPDLNIPANAVTGALEFIDDGDTGNDPTYGHPLSQDACSGTSPAPSASSLLGKIAVVYRGQCQFGHKASVAEKQGAIACIIINHTGAPVGMAGGDSGLVVTIPVIMISEQDGQLLQAAIANGDITQAFIGNKLGIFNDDLGSNPGDVLRARRYSNLAPLSQNASEFSVPVGAWVRNFGSQTQSNGMLKCIIDNGTQIYADSAAVPSINTGDSTFVSLSTFSQSTYPVGEYTMTYTIITNQTTGDEEPGDNVIDASFMISDSLYSYGRLDPVTYKPLSPGGFRAGTFTTDWEACLAFQDPNASRMRSLGMTVSNTTSSTEVLTGTFFEIRVYEWNDVFTDVNDPNLNISNLNQLDAAFYVYGSDLQDSSIFVSHNSPIQLVDNQRYLFCLNQPSQTVMPFAGYDTQIDYSTTQQDDAMGANGAHLQPSTPGSTDATYFLNGFGLDVQLAASIHLDEFVGIDEIDTDMDIVPFPNPVKDELNIPVGNVNGTALIELFDVAGKLVISRDVTFAANSNIKLNVSNVQNGSYIGKITFENGTTSKFNVVVNK